MPSSDSCRIVGRNEMDIRDQRNRTFLVRLQKHWPIGHRKLPHPRDNKVGLDIIILVIIVLYNIVETKVWRGLAIQNSFQVKDLIESNAFQIQILSYPHLKTIQNQIFANLQKPNCHRIFIYNMLIIYTSKSILNRNK